MPLIAEEIVGGLPGNGLTRSDEDFGVISFPVIRFEIVEVVALVHAGEAPVETGLVFVMTGAEFGESALAIGSNDGVDVGSRRRGSDLGENLRVTAVDRDQASFRVVSETQVICAPKRGISGQEEEEQNSGHFFLN